MSSHTHHKHTHPGRPSSVFFTSEEVLNRLDIKEGTTLLDAGCGDGFISIAASNFVGDEGKVYAVDVDKFSIESLKARIEQNSILNIEPIRADISKRVPIEDDMIDQCLMVNVFHGLVENEETDLVLKEIKRVVKIEGTVAIIEFKKTESFPGPPISIRLEPEQMESIVREYEFVKKDYFEIGKYHYGMIFGNL
jgi:ubiquinone/menaquinone biosynthesis C-methylase UbiE